MRTETDVFNRIRWDPSLAGFEFFVGFSALDKFTKEKIIEECTVDEFPMGVVPMHVIKYFKFNDVVVWDRPNLMDNFFGSVTATQKAQGVVRSNIYEIIREYQENQPHDIMEQE